MVLGVEAPSFHSFSLLHLVVGRSSSPEMGVKARVKEVHLVEGALHVLRHDVFALCFWLGVVDFSFV
jgi:hypothetical protein